MDMTVEQVMLLAFWIAFIIQSLWQYNLTNENKGVIQKLENTIDDLSDRHSEIEEKLRQDSEIKSGNAIKTGSKFVTKDEHGVVIKINNNTVYLLYSDIDKISKFAKTKPKS